ncbi:hypothetical protein JD844_006087 [Phrynosoma platyrhinos]|uniref:ERCC1-like central domain-containing protein n=1 Tax=Phrynosoma platyrhinos TaxID=52577 RepID=A0ABQ7TPX2_PHRPL|nr:hypothetical protein JD844_006087 [Phrynosoma platyrhinos]
MESQEAKKVPEAKKKFTIKTQDEDQVAPVKPLFKASSEARASQVPETSVASGGASYADYIVGQAVASSAPQVKQEASDTAATKPTLSGVLPPHEQTRTTMATLNATEENVALNPALKPGAKHNKIIVSPRQRGNPILKFIRNMPWEFGEVVPDYVLGQSTCSLFLSLRYHNLNPNYIHERLRNLGKTYALRILLLQVDVKDPHQALKELAKICILADCTLILAWRFLANRKGVTASVAAISNSELQKMFLILSISQASPPVRVMTDCLTSMKSVNKTDTLSLLSTFGARRLFDVLHEPFLKVPKRTEASCAEKTKD